MTVAELLQGLAEYPPDALVMFKHQGIIGPVSGLEAKDLARVDGLGCYPVNSLVLKVLQLNGFEATYFPAAVMAI